MSKPNRYLNILVFSIFLSFQLSVMAQELQDKPEKPVEVKSVEIKRECQIRPLSGSLDNRLFVNSNSPEIVRQEGILLSTFPPQGKTNPAAHLNLALEGNFMLFSHHINKAEEGERPRTLHIVALVFNPDQKEKASIKILSGASYLSQPDAPFKTLPTMEENPDGLIYAGPGDRICDDFLFGKRNYDFSKSLTLKPQETKILFNLPIPVRKLSPCLNGRSTLLSLKSSGPVYIATVALYARDNEAGSEDAPLLEECIRILNEGNLAGPRDKEPSPPGALKLIYGRVAGVQRGSAWKVTLSDNATDVAKLRIPASGGSFSYPLSSLEGGTFGTQQVQSAPLVVRYQDTAYQAHGNYGVEYDLTLPLFNDSPDAKEVSIKFQNPLKSNQKAESLTYLEPPAPNVFFRGTVQLKYKDDNGSSKSRYIHLVLKKGQESQELVNLKFKPMGRRLVEFRFFYPPDATPPQVLTVTTH
ncbi:MAG: DUF3370 domain-containing protein [Candidatus Melainabacteria bacterium]|nr:DUF3370 domain-containing protein [Candidatus Melainabacteria bacterium]